NSVKVTIDTYDGLMNFYVVDDTDPIIQAYRKIFPDIFSEADEMPDELLSHLRYPEDLFRVQADMYSKYHLTDPRTFFNDGDPWQIARDPSTAGFANQTAVEADDSVIGEQFRARFFTDAGDEYTPMVPYYLLMKLPGEEELAYLLVQPFTPENRPNMVSFVVARSGPEQYGGLVEFQLPRDRFIDGPGQVGARIQQDPVIARDFTLLGQEGSQLILGNMLVVPIEDSVIYVQPVYLKGEEIALPEFKRVVVVYQDNQPQMRETLDEALAAVFGEGIAIDDPPLDDGGTPPEILPEDLQALLQQADALIDEANAALRNGDLGTYQEKVDEAQALIDEALSQLDIATTEGAAADASLGS
ncbi:MAG: UPF0182 family protein, partial [Candidatus Deferrimicrobiaceae bacterium]